VATELGTAYVSVWANTEKLESQIKAALDGSGKSADKVGNDIGNRISASASKAMKDGWRPDQDIMAGIPDTKLDHIGARIGQIIGKGVVGGLRAKQAGTDFANAFGDGAGSIGLGKVIGGWRKELSGGAIHAMGFLAGKTLSAGLTAGVGLGVAGIGMALTSGFDRLEKLDSAKSRLNSLNESLKRFNKPLIDVQKAVKDVTDVVTGTPFSLDAAFGSAVGAIGANVTDIKGYMTALVDAAAVGQTSLEDMGSVFQDIANEGALSAETLNRLDARIPATSWVKESVERTGGDFKKMLADGQISLNMLQKIIEDHASNTAQGLGNTLSGSIDIMKTKIAVVGADLLSAIFGGQSGDPAEGMKEAINRITEQLKNLDSWIKSHKEQIRTFFEDAKTAAKNLVDMIGKVLEIIHNIPGGITTVVAAFGAWKAIEGVAALITTLKSISTLLRVTLPADAALGAGLISKALGAISIPAALLAILQWERSHERQTAQDEGKTDSLPIGPRGMPMPVAPRDNGQFGGPNSQRERRGLNPVDPTGGLLGGTLSGGGDNGSLIPGMGVPGVGGGGNGYIGNTGDPVERWRPMVRKALAQYGPQYGITNMSAWEQKMMTQIRTESAGNPSVFNNYDSNAQAGHPSRGLLQFIPSTFAQHNITGGDIMDPYAQIAAFIPYVSQRYGMDRNGSPLQVGRGVGYDSGGWLKPGVTQAVNNTGQPEAVFTQSQLQDMRTAGAIPAAAGSTAQAGTSAISSAIDMGGQVINGIIDQAASAASTAATLGGAAVGNPEAGALSATAIGLGTNAAKRGVTYGFDIAGILADSVLQQVTPFGQPRWLNQDFTGFVPQQAITGALGNLMSGGAQQAAGSGSLLDPKTKEHGTMTGAAPGPIDTLMGTIDPASPTPMISDANSFLSTQPMASEAPAPNQPPMFKVDNIYTQDVDSLGRELNKQGRLAQMQYTNRPGP